MTTTKTTSNVNFTIEFGNKNIVIKFNPAQNAPEHKIGLNGKSYQSVAFANALGEVMNLINPSYKVRQPGMYLHMSLAEAREGLGNDNIGYVDSANLQRLIETGEVTYRNEIMPNEIYRLHYDGLTKVYASMVVVKEYVEGEHEAVRHNRNAYALIRNMEILRKAEVKGINIRLFYTEDEAKRFELLKNQWEMFLNEDYDGVAASIREGIGKAKTYNTLKHYERIAERAAEKGETFGAKAGYMVRTVDGTEIDPAELVGKTIKFVDGKFTSPMSLDVTADNLATVVATLRARGLKVAFVQQVATEEVVDMVIESKAPKARKTRKATK